MKRKTLSIIIVLVINAILIVGCEKNTEEKKSIKQKATEVMERIEESSIEAEKERTQTPKELYNYSVYVWTDEETGVQYIVYSYKNGYGGMGGITPRLNGDGTVMVEKR